MDPFATLKHEVDQLRRERDTLTTKVSLLSYKLEMSNKNEKLAKELSARHLSDAPSATVGLAATKSRPIRAHPSGLKERSVSVPDAPLRTTSCTDTPTAAARIRSCSGAHTIHVTRHRSQLKPRTQDDDERHKRQRAWANAYELSQDLRDKQVEMLERKYGGAERTRTAATVIQQAFRQYTMNKNFEKLRYCKSDKRLSRRLSDLRRSNTIWTDVVVDATQVQGLLPLRTCSNNTATTATCDVTHDTVDATSRLNSGMTKSQTIGIVTHEQLASMNRRPLQRSQRFDLSVINDVAGTSPQLRVGPSPLLLAAEERTDSSASVTPQEVSQEQAVDLHSVNFEQLLESKETDILNDSFHSESSQDATVIVHNLGNDLNGNTFLDIDSVVHRTLPLGSADQQLPNNNELSSQIDEHLEEDEDVITKVYANTEVRLRRRRSDKSTNATSNAPSDDAIVISSEDQTHPVVTSSTRRSPEASPIWKRKSAAVNGLALDGVNRMSNISELSEPDSLDGGKARSSRTDADMSSSPSATSGSDSASLGSAQDPAAMATNARTYTQSSVSDGETVTSHTASTTSLAPRISDRQKKRLYRIGLNLFNKKPEKGVQYLVERGFVQRRPNSVASFLIRRKGLSKQMIGEYLGNLQNQFNMDTLDCFAREIDLEGMQLDVALRRFQSYFRMPGEAQKIERLMEAFAARYCICNPEQVKSFRSPDTVFLLAFAIIMLNTDQHNLNIKPERRMKLPDFIKNLRGIDDGEDVDHDLLAGIYNRIKCTEFKPGTDHVSQVAKVENMMLGRKLNLALPHRRLVCYCRLYEVNDPNKREKLGLHQREIFLFNDSLLVAKIFSKKKSNITYNFRHSFPLCGMLVYLFETPHYKHGIRLSTNIDGKVIIMFNARNEHDRMKFVEDLKEAIMEMNEMESIRIEEELQKQKFTQNNMNFNRHSKDSGVVDIDLLKATDPGVHRLSAPECGHGLKNKTLSNSLLDLAEGGGQRRGSGGSLDSGMASTGSAGSAVDSAKQLKTNSNSSSTSSFKIAGLFSKRTKASKTSLRAPDSSEV